MAAISDISVITDKGRSGEIVYFCNTRRRDDGSRYDSYSATLSESGNISRDSSALTKFSTLCNSQEFDESFFENLSKAKVMAREYLAKLGSCCIGCGQELYDSKEIIKTAFGISFNIHNSDECIRKAVHVNNIADSEMVALKKEVEVARCILAIKACSTFHVLNN